MCKRLLIIITMVIALAAQAQDTIVYRKKVIVRDAARLVLTGTYPAVFSTDSVVVDRWKWPNEKTKRTANSLFVFEAKNLKKIYYEKQ